MQEHLKKDGTPDKRFKAKKIASLNPTRIDAKVKEFFEVTDPLDWSVPNLCIYLDMSKSMFKNLAHDGAFESIHEYAMNKIESAYFRELKTAKNPTGAIFALKTLGYSDRRGVDVAFSGKVSIENVLKDTKLKA